MAVVAPAEDIGAYHHVPERRSRPSEPVVTSMFSFQPSETWVAPGAPPTIANTLLLAGRYQ